MSALAGLIEPKKIILKERQFITNKEIGIMVAALIGEQLLQLIVGIADTTIASYAGDAAVAGVSLVNTIYSVFIFVFSSIGVGGCVVISQYIGNNNYENGRVSAALTVKMTLVFSLISMALMLIFGDSILHVLYKSADESVLENARIYQWIVVLSFPGNALYNAGANIYKSMGKTGVTMKVSAVVNAVNIIGDLLGVFVFKMGAAGVAWPTTISWYVAAIIMMVLCMKPDKDIYFTLKHLKLRSRQINRKILDVAIPNTLENGLFQVAKVILASVISTFGIAQLTANGINQSIWNMTSLLGLSMGPAYISIVGRAVGAKDMEAIEYYTVKLSKYNLLLAIIWNVFMSIVLFPYVMMCKLSPDVEQIVISTTLVHNIFTGIVAPIALSVPNALRAANDTKFCMYSAVLCTCFIRVIMTYALGKGLNMGIYGYMWAMHIDWIVKAVMVIIRYYGGKWKKKALI